MGEHDDDEEPGERLERERVERAESILLTRLDERYKALRDLHKEDQAEIKAVKAIAYETRGRVDLLVAVRDQMLEPGPTGETGLVKAIREQILVHERARRLGWREWGGWGVGILGFLLALAAYLKGG